MSLLPTSTRLGTAIVSSDAIHQVVALRQHAARRAGQARRIAVLAHPDFIAGAERCQPSRIQIIRPLARPLVPGFASLGVTEAGTGVEDHQRPRHRGVRLVERQRHVAAQRQAADHRALNAAGVQNGGHIRDGGGLRISCRISPDSRFAPWPRISHTITW